MKLTLTQNFFYYFIADTYLIILNEGELQVKKKIGNVEARPTLLVKKLFM